MSAKWILASLGFLLAFTQCSFLPSQRALRKCQFEPMGYALEGVTDQGILGTVQIRAINPGKTKAQVHRMRLWLLHTQDTLAQVQIDTTVDLPAKDTLMVPMAVVLPFSALGHLAGPLANGERLECQLIGDVWIDTPVGTYTAKNALRKNLTVDLGPVRQSLYKALGMPWLRNWMN